MTGHYITALLSALLVEGAQWLRLRWDFEEKAASRAWQLTTIATGITAVFIWLDGNRLTALPRLLVWLPPLLLPMQFIQSYGLRNWMPLTALSFFSRQRMERKRRLGVESPAVHFHFGNVLFIVLLVAATLGEETPIRYIFLPGIALLTLWALLAISRSYRWPLFLALCLAAGIAVAGEYGLGKAYDYLNRGGARDRVGGSSFDPEFNKTSIGSLGPLKMSRNIIWRITIPPGAKVPKLLRTASYDTYVGVVWKNTPSAQAREAGTDFRDLLVAGSVENPYYLLQDQQDPRLISDSLPRFLIRGAASTNTPLPLPGDTASLKDFDLDSIERNTMGTVRVLPKRAIIEGTVLWQGGTTPDAPADAAALKITGTKDSQQGVGEVIHEVATQLRLAEQPTTQAKLQTLRAWFSQNFEYTRYLSIPRVQIPSKTDTEIGRFLTKTRKGHCEYFATTATLLLRDAGVPTRYAIGYAVMEKDPKRPEYLLRGIHSHAWCRVWDAEAAQWIDFDATPSNWLSLDDTRASRTQWLTDATQRLREDFFLWRNRPANRLAVTVVMVLIAVGVLGFIGWKLWGSRRRIHAEKRRGASREPWVRTPLHELEPLASKHLGPRPPGMTLPQWLRGMPYDPAQLEEAIELHQRLRFDPQTADASVLERLASLVKGLKRKP